MEKDHYILLIYKRLRGIISQREEQSLQTWEKQEEENRKLVQEVERAWEESESYELPFALDEDADFAKIQARIAHRPASAKRVQLPQQRRIWWRVAAAIAFLVAVVFVVRNILPADEQEWISVVATTEIIEFELADGSRVWLNEESEISYPAEFSGDIRPVKLEGEAFFAVSKDSDRPFTVETAHTTTTVLGTAFNVKAMGTEAATEVSVEEGLVKVAAKSTNEAVLLTAQEKGIYEHREERLSKQKDENLNALSWKRKSVQFNGNALAEVLEVIGKKYQVRIQLEKETMSSCPISGRYGTKTSILNLLQDITAVHDMKIEQPTENEYILSGGTCN